MQFKLIPICLLLLFVSGSLSVPGNEKANNGTNGNENGNGNGKANSNVNKNMSMEATSFYRQQKRTLEVNIDGEGRRVGIQYKFDNSTIKFGSAFWLKTAGFPQSGAKFVMKNNETDVKFGFRVGLLKIAEVNEAKGLFVKNSTNVINFTGSTQYWSAIQSSNVGPANSVKKFTTVYSKSIPNSDKNVLITLDAFVSEEEVKIDNFTIRPTALKYGLTIENFPYQFNDSSLAIVKGVMYRTSIVENYSPNDNTFSVGAFGRFNWTPKVLYFEGTNSTEGLLSVESNITKRPDELGVDQSNSGGADPDKVESEGVKFVVFKTIPGNFSKIFWDPDIALEEDAISAQIKSSAIMTTASFGLSVLALMTALLVNFF